MKCFFTLLLLVSVSFFAQSQTYKDDFVRTKSRAVYLEVLGNGFSYSFNYDQRFQNRLDGLGFKAGGSYFAIDGTSVATFPFGLNYLLGKNGKYFEMGLGGTYLLASERNTLFGNGGDRSYERGFSGNMIFGYRSEPVNGGFLFRASITPFFGYGIFWPLFGGLSVGYAF
jgi:hypothetical protein